MKYLLVACAGALSTVAMGKGSLRANQPAFSTAAPGVNGDATMNDAEHRNCGLYGPKDTFTCGPSCDMECMEESDDSTMAASMAGDATMNDDAEHRNCGLYGPKDTFTCGPSCDMECMEESDDSTMGAMTGGDDEHQDCGPYGPKGTFTCGPTCHMECKEESDDSTMGAMTGGDDEHQDCGPYGPKGTFTCGPSCHMECKEESGDGSMDSMNADGTMNDANDAADNGANSGDAGPAHGQGNEVPPCAQTCQGKPTTCEMAFEFMEPQGCGGSCPQAMKDHLLMDMGCSPDTAATGGGDSANIDGGAKVQDVAAELLGDANNDDEAANIDADAKVENVAADLLDELER